MSPIQAAIRKNTACPSVKKTLVVGAAAADLANWLGDLSLCLRRWSCPEEAFLWLWWLPDLCFIFPKSFIPKPVPVPPSIPAAAAPAPAHFRPFLERPRFWAGGALSSSSSPFPRPLKRPPRLPSAPEHRAAMSSSQTHSESSLRWPVITGDFYSAKTHRKKLKALYFCNTFVLLFERQRQRRL